MSSIHLTTYQRGASRHPLFQIWSGIVRRCFDVTFVRYDHWGGRGITICDEWLCFETFVLDIGERPSMAHSLERRDNDKGYSKDNCYWATPKEQANNTRRNIWITINGDTRTVQQWATHLGISSGRIYTRLRKGWDPVEAVLRPVWTGGKKFHPMTPRKCEPIKRNSRLITYKGKTQTVTAFAREYGLKPNTLRERLNAGWSLRNALTQPLLPPMARKKPAF